MPQNTILQNDSPHEVRIRQGSNVAEHSIKQNKGGPLEQVVQPPTSTGPQAPLLLEGKNTKVRKKTPNKTRNRNPSTNVERSAKSTAKNSAKSTHSPQTAEMHSIEAALLWEQDNPIKRRLTALNERNEKLAKHLQTLQPLIQNTGK